MNLRKKQLRFPKKTSMLSALICDNGDSYLVFMITMVCSYSKGFRGVRFLVKLKKKKKPKY